MNCADSASPPSGTDRPVTASDYPYFAAKLQERMDMIRISNLEQSLHWRGERPPESSTMHDLQDDAFADGMAQTELAQMVHELAEIGDLEAAQLRIRHAQYARCVNCAEPIPWRRLEAYPTAKRWIACQERRERFKEQ